MPSSGLLRRVAFVRTEFFEGTYRMHRLLLIANVVLSSPILVTLMMQAIRSYETSVLARVTRRNIPEYGILHSHHRENPESYK
jgi:hypothetical protein